VWQNNSAWADFWIHKWREALDPDPAPFHVVDIASGSAWAGGGFGPMIARVE
jgi:hypothetical protein